MGAQLCKKLDFHTFLLIFGTNISDVLTIHLYKQPADSVKACHNRLGSKTVLPALKKS